jgi:hypothetical protein
VKYPYSLTLGIIEAEAGQESSPARAILIVAGIRVWKDKEVSVKNKFIAKRANQFNRNYGAELSV